jgi:ribosomal protein L40E
MIFFAIGIICAIYFGFTIIKNSKSARDYGLKIDTIASSVSAFSFMLIFTWIGITIIAAASKLSLFSPICGVVGPILLLIGFRAYHGKASESKLIGAILMLVSIALIYFVAYRGGLHSFLGLGAGLLGFQWPGPLLSELTLEILALLIATVCAVIFAFPILGEELKKSIAGIILSISGILFSVGVMYFNFSTVSAIDRLLSLVGMTQWIPGVPRITLDTIWIMFFGFLLLGISGTLGLVTACLPLAISAKELSTRLEAPRPKTPEGAPPKPSDVKYCTKCGASMPLDAIYCLKCGQKQPKEEKV